MAALSGSAALAQQAAPPSADGSASIPKRTPPALVKRDTTAPDKAMVPYLLPAHPPAPSGDDGSTAGKSNPD